MVASIGCSFSGTVLLNRSNALLLRWGRRAQLGLAVIGVDGKVTRMESAGT